MLHCTFNTNLGAITSFFYLTQEKWTPAMERNTVDKEAFLCNIACGSNSRDVVRRIAFWRKAWSQRWQKWWNSMHCTDSWGCNWQTKKIKKKIVIELTRHFAASAQKRAKKVEKLVGLLLSSFCRCSHPCFKLLLHTTCPQLHAICTTIYPGNVRLWVPQ